MQKHLSQPIFAPRPISRKTYIQAITDDMVGTLTGFPLLMLLLIKCTVPLAVYVLDIKFWRLSFLQLYAILLFTGVRFSLINTLLERPNVDLCIDFSFFLL